MRETHVAGEAQHDLWRSIPPSSNVFGDEISVETSLSVGTSPRRISSCETEVQDFELTVIIDQEVTQLEVTGNDVRGVNVLETAKGLMNKRPEMSVGEWLLGADLCREHSVAQLADAERGAPFAMVCRSASINSDSWKVRVSLYQTETRVGVREGNARINKPRQDFNLVRKPDPCRRDAPRIWAPLNGLETFPMYILLATEVVQQPVVKRAYDEGEYG